MSLPVLEATFDLAPDGMRARHGCEVSIDIKPRLSLSTLEADADWKSVDLERYPVVYLPVSIFIDEPWPSQNYKASFTLVLSGRSGFGTTAGDPFQLNYEATSDR